MLVQYADDDPAVGTSSSVIPYSRDGRIACISGADGVRVTETHPWYCMLRWIAVVVLPTCVGFAIYSLIEQGRPSDNRTITLQGHEEKEKLGLHRT
jgi:hypothetical protein